MIARRGNTDRHVTDYGPCPGGVDSMYAPEIAAIRQQWNPAPVEVRYLPADELAAIRARDEANPEVRKTIINEPRREDRTVVLWEAIREANGNLSDAARALGKDPANFRATIRRHREAGRIPPDVRSIIDAHLANYRGEAMRGKHHRPETRALLTLRNLERWAKVRAERAA